MTVDRRYKFRPAVGLPILAFSFASVMAGTTMPTPVYALYAQQMNFGMDTTTEVYAAFPAGMLAALLIFGRWSDVLGRRPLLLASVACAILSSATFPVADSIPLLLAARVLSGLSAGLFVGAGTAAIIEGAPCGWRSHAAMVAAIGNVGGLGFGALMAGLLVQYAAWPAQLTFVVHIGLVTLAGAGIIFVIETAPRRGKIGI